MDKFVIRKERPSISSVVSSTNPNSSQNVDGDFGDSIKNMVGDDDRRGKRARTENTCDGYVSDPALRKAIDEYDPLVRDDVRREYVAKGPCQPFSHAFPRNSFGKKSRCFQAGWFRQWEWLEYSVSKDAAFCFWCYLFRGTFGNDVFVKTGFRNWKKGTERFKEHEGVIGSRHNNARTLFFAFKDQMQSVIRRGPSGKQVLGAELVSTVDVAKFLVGTELREPADSLYRGNCLEVLDWYGSRNVDVACSSETTKAIISDIGDKFFSLMIDEGCDSSAKDQITIVVRYVNNHGVVVERFLGNIHAVDTAALSLKSGIDDFFAKHGLSISKLRGQGYNGASNLRGELDGLKTLILIENPCARYIHCFAHQLQSVIVAVSQKNQCVSDFFEFLSMITDMVGASCKIKDEFRQKQHEDIVEMLVKGEISTQGGLHQEGILAPLGDTCWGSHYTTIVRLLSLWSSTILVLENIFDDGTELRRGFASSLVEKMGNYQFVFIAHLMNLVLGVTNVLSQFLQQKDRNIVEAVSLVQNTKRKIQDLKVNGWDALLGDVNSFCVKNDIIILNMEDQATGRFPLRRDGHDITNHYHFRVGIFDQVIDQISEEMENRFSESNMELLTCIACLDPTNSFSNFSESKLLRLAEFYPGDFLICDKMELQEQLKMWVYEMRGNESFSPMQDIGALAKKMVDVGIYAAFHLVYRLIELVLVLPIVTATVELHPTKVPTACIR